MRILRTVSILLCASQVTTITIKMGKINAIEIKCIFLPVELPKFQLKDGVAI